MHRGDILDVDLLVQGSRVQAGRRPAIAILADAAIKVNPVIAVVPLTSNLGALRFRYSFQIQPSQDNGLTAPSVAMVFQLTVVDRVNVIRVRGHLEDGFMAQLDSLLRDMLGL